MMPPYTVLHIICSIEIKPQQSQVHMHMLQIWGVAPPIIFCSRWLIEANLQNFPAIRYDDLLVQDLIL